MKNNLAYVVLSKLIKDVSYSKFKLNSNRFKK